MDEEEKLKMSKYSKKERNLKEDIESIVENKNSDEIRRRIGMYKEQYNNPAILPILFDVLKSDSYDDKVRLGAAAVLGSYIDEAEKIIPIIMKILEIKTYSIAIKKKLLESLSKFEGKAVTTIPKLEAIRDKAVDISFRIEVSEVIELLRNPIIYPACPKCNKNSFAYHPIPTTTQVEEARRNYTHIVRGGSGSASNRPVKIQFANNPTYAAIVYCLNCGYIISAIGGYK
jgi:hypothetical protein